MRLLGFSLTFLACAALAGCREDAPTRDTSPADAPAENRSPAAGEPEAPAPQPAPPPAAETAPASPVPPPPAVETSPADFRPPAGQGDAELTANFTGADVAGWTQLTADGRKCRASSALSVPPGHEINLYRVTVAFSGRGLVELSVAHHNQDDLAQAIGTKNRYSWWKQLESGKQVRASSRFHSERFAWIVLRVYGDVRVDEVSFACWRGQGTVRGHVAGTFEFAGAKLPYRLMYPRNYDPSRAYPLVLSVSGSAGVGSDNVRSMEMVTLAYWLFTGYYPNPKLACFSLVPQIPPSNVPPAPYWPKGESGKPTMPYRPDASMVNENGWYAEATLALIRALIDSKETHVDPGRVYCTGFSYGGKACWELLKADRRIFAAAACGAGWPIGPAYSKPAGELRERLKLEVSRYKHVPVHAFAGGKDAMRLGSRAVCEEIVAQGGKATYVEFRETAHAATAGKCWGDRQYVEWIFRQNRKNNPDPGPDPFPQGVYPSPQ
jgi:poly(3-hydroxybutyrate) depolymerase